MYPALMYEDDKKIRASVVISVFEDQIKDIEEGSLSKEGEADFEQVGKLL